MTHGELVALAAYWLSGTRGCSVVLTERRSRCDEHPDAIGWAATGSHVVEAKASRSDFFADSRKEFRANAGGGMGDFRWYIAPAGLIQPNELPERWGLVEVKTGGSPRKKVAAQAFPVVNRQAEVWLLSSELALIHIAQNGGTLIDTPRARETLRGFADAKFEKTMAQLTAEDGKESSK